jgi:hypothetical protein
VGADVDVDVDVDGACAWRRAGTWADSRRTRQALNLCSLALAAFRPPAGHSTIPHSPVLEEL